MWYLLQKNIAKPLHTRTYTHTRDWRATHTHKHTRKRSCTFRYMYSMYTCTWKQAISTQQNLPSVDWDEYSWNRLNKIGWMEQIRLDYVELICVRPLKPLPHKRQTPVVRSYQITNELWWRQKHKNHRHDTPQSTVRFIPEAEVTWAHLWSDNIVCPVSICLSCGRSLRHDEGE